MVATPRRKEIDAHFFVLRPPMAIARACVLAGWSLLAASACGCGSSCEDSAFSSGGVITVVHAKELLAGKTSVTIKYCVDASCVASSVPIHDAPNDAKGGWVPVYADRETITIRASPAPPSRFEDKAITVSVDVDGKQFSASVIKLPVDQGRSCDPDPSIYTFSVSFDAGKP